MTTKPIIEPPKDEPTLAEIREIALKTLYVCQEILARMGRPIRGFATAAESPEDATWEPPTEAEYDAGAQLPPARSPEDYERVVALARVGRSPLGTLCRGWDGLLRAYAEIDELIAKRKTYFADMEYPPSWAAQQAIVILGPGGWEYKEPHPIAGRKLADFAGKTLADVMAEYFFSGGGPSGG